MSVQIQKKHEEPQDACETRQIKCLVNNVSIISVVRFLWSTRLLIFSITAVFFVGSVVFANSQPNIYRVTAQLMLDLDPYDTSHSTTVNMNSRQQHDVMFYINSFGIWSDIKKISGTNLDINDIGINYGGNGIISLNYYDPEPEKAYRSMQVFVESIDLSFRQYELEKTNIYIDTIKRIMLKAENDKVTDSLVSRYASLLFKRSLLENNKSTILQIVQMPQMPVNPFKPKRVYIVLLGSLLGVMLGIMLALFRFRWE